MLIWWLIMWFFGVLLSVPIAVILTIIFQNWYKLESDDLLQMEKQSDEEENKEMDKIKKQLKMVETVKNKLSTEKVKE